MTHSYTSPETRRTAPLILTRTCTGYFLSQCLREAMRVRFAGPLQLNVLMDSGSKARCPLL